MAIDKRLVDGKNGVLEKNAVTYPRTGNIMAMYPLKEGVKGENGMLLAVNYVDGKIEYPTASSEVIMILDSAEKEYDKNVAGLDQHYLTSASGFLPRLGKLTVNDRFTTSTVSYDSAVFANAEAIETAIKAGSVYGIPCTTTGFEGTIALTKTAPTGVIGLKAIALTTIPNGDVAIKFAVIKAN
jgi:hypothetical protein